MATTVIEAKRPRRAEGVKTRERQYIIREASTETAAISATLASGTVPATIGDLVRDPSVEVEEIGSDIWLATVRWANPNFTAKEPDSFEISFDISTQTVHITQSIATVNRYAASGDTARDFKGAVNVNEDGSVDGVDILVPALSFVLKYVFAPEDVNDAYIATLMATAGKVNSDSFHEFAAGTLILTKVSGAKNQDGNWDITFGFSCSENATGLTVGSITGINKKGWEYMWVYYATQTVDAGGGLTYTHKVPKSVYVEQVYKTTAYSALGI